MYRSDRILRQFFFGNNPDSLFIRFELVKWEDVTIHIDFHGSHPASLEFSPKPDAGCGAYRFQIAGGKLEEIPRLASSEVAELAVPLKKLGIDGESLVRFQVKVLQGGLERECYPERVPIEFHLTRKEYALEHWMV